MADILDFKLEDARNYLDTLEDESMRLSLTDPPYIISKKSGFMSVGKKANPSFRMEHDFGEWDKIPLDVHYDLLNDVTKKIYQKLVPGGVLIMFYDYWKIESLKAILEGSGFKMLKILEWQKTNPVPVNSKYFYLTGVRELAIACVKGGKPKFNSSYHRGIFSFPIPKPKGGRIHPNEKSIRLMSELIELHTDVGENVLDPFAGSAAVLLSALMVSRNAYGCEINETYYQKANARLQQYMKKFEPGAILKI